MSNPLNTGINWGALPNNGARIVAPPLRRTPAQIQEAAMRLHAERMAAGPWPPPGWEPPRPKPAVLNPNAFPKGALTLSNKNKQISHYEKQLRNLEALQQVKQAKKLPNVNSRIAAFLTGTEKKSLNQQIKEVKNVLEKLKSPARGGTRRKRHLKSRFKSSKRKTT